MYIKNLNINNFRNYKELFLEFHKKINLIRGDNAQGKTNILEAIYLTSLGKSFRTLKEKELINFNEEYARIHLEYRRETEGDGFIEIAIDKKGRRFGKVNGIKIERNSQLIDNVLVVIFSPDDLRIVKEDPIKRRRFIDRELCQLKVSYYKNINGYNRVLAQRNAYLKEDSVDCDILDIWNSQLCNFGEEIIKERISFVEKINRLSMEIHNTVTGSNEKLEVKYCPGCTPGFLKENLLESAKEDKRRGTTTKGPHRDDIDIFVDGVSVKSFGSQGQQKTAALSLKLAEIKLFEEETGETPVLLLDDVFSELDQKRQIYLLKFLENVQIFITAADISEKVIEGFKEGMQFKVKNGEILIKESIK